MHTQADILANLLLTLTIKRKQANTRLAYALIIASINKGLT